jgi:hypothetical protein
MFAVKFATGCAMQFKYNKVARQTIEKRYALLLFGGTGLLI